jgi:ABC-type uncharacterized transport system permease subunit
MALNISKFLPFYYTTYFAVNTFIGRIEYGEILNGLFVMAGWAVLLLVLVKLVWAGGLKKYIAAGG